MYRYSTFIAFILFVTLYSTTVQSQNKFELIRTLNQKAGEIVGNIKVVNSKRFIVDGNSVSYNGDLMTIAFEVDKERYYYEFNPAGIEKVEDGSIDDKSSVGVLVITLKAPLTKFTQYLKKSVKEERYQQKVYFNYLNKDRDNLYIVKTAFENLAAACRKDAEQIPLATLLDFWTTEDEIWTSVKKESISYKLTDQYMMGCNLYIFYTVNRVTLNGDYSGKFLTIVPMTGIDGINLMKKNTRPESFFLEAKRDGFPTYEMQKSSSYYTYSNALETVPIFIKNLNRTENEKFIQILNTALINCRGDRVRMKTVD